MARSGLTSRLLNGVSKAILGVRENPSRDLGDLRSMIVIRQHNQLGDLIASVCLFRAIRETYPGIRLTVVVSPANAAAVLKNEFIDHVVVFDKKRLLNPAYFIRFLRVLRAGYDAALTPVTVSLSYTSDLLARLTKAKTRIGAKRLEGKTNESAYFYDRRVELDWRDEAPKSVSDKGLDVVRPFGIEATTLQAVVTFDDDDRRVARGFLDELEGEGPIVGAHVGAGKKPNIWAAEYFADALGALKLERNARVYFTGSRADAEAIEAVSERLGFAPPVFRNRTINEVAALIDASDLFVSNDTGVMHVAGATSTPLIAIFGPTDPRVWAPVGESNRYVRNSDNVNDVSAREVLELANRLLDAR
ncbi:MAG: ADP-heptose--LPS heptosyltransferase [Ignavibacteriales bacterium]|nr:ADP-heptose--LPS heptosyltransferase [Ignavibacteriales bacterium]